MLSMKRFEPFSHIALALVVVFGVFHAWKYVSEHYLAEGMEEILNVQVEKDMPTAESVVAVRQMEDAPAPDGVNELGSSDLLPMSSLGSWNDIHPGGIGALENKNFLNSGHHIGVNQIGQSLRNANYGLRSDPANPQKVVSPWGNTTIVSDELRRPLEVGMTC